MSLMSLGAFAAKHRPPASPARGAPARATKKVGSSRAPNESSDGLTGKQALAVWELILTSDDGLRRVRLDKADADALVSKHLIARDGGSKRAFHVTDAGWEWANRRGFTSGLWASKDAARVLEAFLAKVGGYLEFHGLALDDLLRPRRREPQQVAHVAPAALEQSIREAYLRVTGGVMNETIKLARLRDALGPEPHEAVDEELRQMQRRGSTVLSPIGDPQLLRPEDEAAAMRVAGQRRDVVCIRS
jgi:hypothetical protein